MTIAIRIKKNGSLGTKSVEALKRSSARPSQILHDTLRHPAVDAQTRSRSEHKKDHTEMIPVGYLSAVDSQDWQSRQSPSSVQEDGTVNANQIPKKEARTALTSDTARGNYQRDDRPGITRSPPASERNLSG
jgi:hypothetical protein